MHTFLIIPYWKTTETHYQLYRIQYILIGSSSEKILLWRSSNIGATNRRRNDSESLSVRVLVTNIDVCQLMILLSMHAIKYVQYVMWYSFFFHLKDHRIGPSWNHNKIVICYTFKIVLKNHILTLKNKLCHKDWDVKSQAMMLF